MATHALEDHAESSHLTPKPLEDAARASLESLLEHALTDAELARIRSRLLEFVNILRAWERAANRNEPSETIRFPKAA